MKNRSRVKNQIEVCSFRFETKRRQRGDKEETKIDEEDRRECTERKLKETSPKSLMVFRLLVILRSGEPSSAHRNFLFHFAQTNDLHFFIDLACKVGLHRNADHSAVGDRHFAVEELHANTKRTRWRALEQIFLRSVTASEIATHHSTDFGVVVQRIARFTAWLDHAQLDVGHIRVPANRDAQVDSEILQISRVDVERVDFRNAVASFRNSDEVLQVGKRNEFDLVEPLVPFAFDDANQQLSGAGKVARSSTLCKDQRQISAKKLAKHTKWNRNYLWLCGSSERHLSTVS
jgi:hypothetical protein